MNLEALKVEPLSTYPISFKFDCGDGEENKNLNKFFLEESYDYQIELIAVTYIVFLPSNKQDLIAYFSVSNDLIDTEGNKPKRNKINRIIPYQKQINKYPAVRIGRLAVNKKYQSKDVGSYILDVIKYWFIHENKTGCRFLTVDAYNRERTLKFYTKNDFKFFPETEKNKKKNEINKRKISEKEKKLKRKESLKKKKIRKLKKPKKEKTKVMYCDLKPFAKEIKFHEKEFDLKKKAEEMKQSLKSGYTSEEQIKPPTT